MEAVSVLVEDYPDHMYEMRYTYVDCNCIQNVTCFSQAKTCRLGLKVEGKFSTLLLKMKGLLGCKSSERENAHGRERLIWTLCCAEGRQR